MISASHNPFSDNGIKLFGPDGYKLSDEAELAIEALIDGDVALAAAGDIGRARRVGITGPPGAGKSTMTTALARALR